MKRTTIKDIAKLLNINVSTVSRALQNHSNVSLSLREKVKQTAELLNYTPNSWAKNFRNNKSSLIGLIIPTMNMFFLPSVIQGITEVLSKKKYNLLILISDESYEKEIENIAICCNQGVEGILISLSAETNDIEHLKKVSELEIPLVIFDKTVPQHLFNEVLINDDSTKEIIGEYFNTRKVKNVLGVFGNKNLGITNLREFGFRDKLDKANISYKIIYANNSTEAQEKTELALKQQAYDSFFAMSDEVLAGIFSAFAESEVNPSEYHIVAISTGELPKFLAKNIYIIKHDGKLMGKKAAKILLKNINKNNLTQTYKKYIAVS